MNRKQQNFCDEYLKDFNGTRAYMVAYPDVKDENVAKSNASRLLTNANVKQYIEEHSRAIHNSKICDAEEIRQLLTEIARGIDTGKSESIVVENVGGGISKARKVTKRPDERDRIKALELLGKCNSLFTEKVDLKASVDISVDVDDEEDEG
jgi:phage terminase small subunit